MAGELLLSAGDLATQARDLAQYSVHVSKPLMVGTLAVVTAGGGALAKKHFNKQAEQSDGAKGGRIKRVPAGHIGLREHNNRFYDSVPVLDQSGAQLIDDKGNPMFTKKFYDLVPPGLRTAPMPLRKYGLLDTRSVSREIEKLKVRGANERQYIVGARFEWGHIKGFDEHYTRKNKQLIEYKWENGEPVSVNELVYNGLMAGRNEEEVSQKVGAGIGSLLRRYIHGLDDPEAVDNELAFDSIRGDGHDKWLKMGAEIRGLEVTEITPTDIDHIVNDTSPSHIANIFKAIQNSNLAHENQTSGEPDIHLVGDEAAG